ncbi:hypothetical protein BHE74_00057074 [Ensete ventricosum]|nr:hypothetical protein GW17_00044664 [Ensete ventricosum]RWW37765.1 hypothetical protein BHE74_00057074 [Ensete ventricosum]
MGFLCQITLFFFPLWVSPAELAVKVDGKSGEQKPGTPTTPRSKHSATEQRRRCKINDRFWKIDQVRLLTAVSQAVASAGVDMSQASISVQINLARRASRRTTTTNMSSAKDHFYHSPINQVIGDSGGPESNVEGSEQAPKRQRVDTS